MEAISRDELEVEVTRLRQQVREGERARGRDAIFDSAVDFAIIVTDPAGVISDWNRGAEYTIGWSAEEMIGSTAERFFTPQDRAVGRIEAEMAIALRDGSAPDERWHLRKDGSKFWASGEMMPLRGDDGSHQGFVKILRDRTGQREAGERLRITEERFRALLEGVETAFAIVEVKFDFDDQPVDYRFIEANQAFERQAGVNLRGRWVSEYAPNLEQFWFDTYGHVAKTGEPATFESYAEAFQRWFDVRAMRVGEPAERQIAIFFNDVTERKRNEEDLHKLNDTLEEQVQERTLELGRLWDASPDLLLVSDRQGFFLKVNPAWHAMLGYSADELIGHHVNEFVVKDDHAKTVDASTLAAKGEQPHLSNRYRHKDGSIRWISWVAASVGEVIYATGRNVTAEKIQADALEQAQEALRQSQKMEAVGQLTGGLAHDFNNILAGISGSLEMMQNRINDGRISEIDRYMAGAQGATKRAAALTHRLLAFSRRQTLAPQPTDISRLVTDMQDLVQRTVGPHIAIKINAGDDTWPILVDPNQLENALLNLCINSRDAMPSGGEIAVEVGNHTFDDKEAFKLDVPPGEYVLMSVTDTGTGMAKGVIDKAFDPFFTTKPIGMGTGLGLSMIYGFVRQSGGQIKIASRPGYGTTISIYLPRHDEQERLEPQASRDTMRPGIQGKTVLVVDDEPLVRMLVLDAVEDLGHTPLEAGDGLQAMDILRSGVDIDLLVTDVGLPNGMNGRQVADAARQLRPGLKILFVTGYAENSVLGGGDLEPGMQIITKPFDMMALSQRIVLMIQD
ncbi:PAS domain S-box protein [Rhizobium sp. SAFR-030]|uniref:PAS domain S-box protein n=1 Tax=Rhizobium sp. SAFR-030 TaxID=3387277 RepID=UPI003F7D2117